jgi:leucyl aminopeptidase
LKDDLLVIPVSLGSETAGAVRELSAEGKRAVARRVKMTAYKGSSGARLLVQLADRDVLLVGIGGADDRDLEDLRRAAARGRAVAGEVRAKRVAICLSGAVRPERVKAAIEGFTLAGYRFDRYRSGDKSSYAGPSRLTVNGARLKRDAASRKAVSEAGVACESVALVRDLVNEMSSVKTPSYLVKTARSITRGTGIRCEVWQGKRLQDEGMNGIIAVSAGSAEPGAFLRMTYKPSGKPRACVAIVGKGVTFDSGGLSLKPAKSMEWMKQDMSGAAVVLGVMKALPALAPQVEVRGYIAAAENMPGQGAQKPGDIITYRNGKTAEVLNTDAEGRLVLADALCVASEDKPDCIIDLATLTGACMVALGSSVAGILGNDQGLVDELIAHGDQTGERMWQLPLVEDYRSDIKSSVADIKNIGAGYGGTITAAMFLEAFVDDVSWAHIDIAGPAFAEKPAPYAPRGGTGFGVRALLSYLAKI